MSHFYFDMCRIEEARTLHKAGFCVSCVRKALESDANAIVFIERILHDGIEQLQREAHPEVSDDSWSGENELSPQDKAFGKLEPEE